MVWRQDETPRAFRENEAPVFGSRVSWNRRGFRADRFERRQECSSEHDVLGSASAHLTPLSFSDVIATAESIATGHAGRRARLRPPPKTRGPAGSGVAEPFRAGPCRQEC